MKQHLGDAVAVGLGEVLFDCDADTKAENFGGAPANFADHFLKCARLLAGEGPQVHVVSAIGAAEAETIEEYTPSDRKECPDEKGRKVLTELRDRELGYCLTAVKSHASGMVVKRKNAAGDNEYDILPAAWDHIVLSDGMKELARKTDVVCFGSLAQREEVNGQRCASCAAIQGFLDEMLAAGRDTLRVFDANIRQHFYSRKVLLESIGKCNILKISDEEAPVVAECLTGYSLAGDPGAFCRALLERHPNLELVILTEGGKGSRIFSGNRISVYEISPKEKIKPVDTVGAGDSFTAAFCAMYLKSGDIWAAQRFASRVSAFVCSDPSATPAYPADAAARFPGA